MAGATAWTERYYFLHICFPRSHPRPTTKNCQLLIFVPMPSGAQPIVSCSLSSLLYVFSFCSLRLGGGGTIPQLTAYSPEIETYSQTRSVVSARRETQPLSMINHCGCRRLLPPPSPSFPPSFFSLSLPCFPTTPTQTNSTHRCHYHHAPSLPFCPSPNRPKRACLAPTIPLL